MILPRRPQLARRRQLPGFTLIELMVVVATIGLLVTLLIGIAGRALYVQRVRNTEAVMSNIQLAIDQFRELNPLRLQYDARTRRSFGDLPPYQQFYNGAPPATPPLPQNITQIGTLVDPGGPNNGQVSANLRARIGRDLCGVAGGAIPNADIVTLADNDGDNNDIRALYAYLRVFVPDAVQLVPDRYRRPLSVDPEFFKPGGPTAPDSERVEVFGFYDAWGVPLDYGMFARVELVPDGTITGHWSITERRALLRSRGVDEDVYKADRQLVRNGGQPIDRTDKWIFNRAAPAPVAQLADARNGIMPNPSANLINSGGWVRVPAGYAGGTRRDDYDYRATTTPDTP